MKVKRRKRLSAALVLFGLTQMGEHYIAVPFVDRDRKLLAAVFFFATCDLGGCELHRRAGYAITDRQGTFFRLYVEPQEEELLAFIRGNAARYSHYLY
jgi:hypothetical protein